MKSYETVRLTQQNNDIFTTNMNFPPFSPSSLTIRSRIHFTNHQDRCRNHSRITVTISCYRLPRVRCQTPDAKMNKDFCLIYHLPLKPPMPRLALHGRRTVTHHLRHRYDVGNAIAIAIPRIPTGRLTNF